MSPGPGADSYTNPSASSTLGGATSQDVYNSLGQPVGGQTSVEVRHNGMHGRKRDAQGVDQWGGSNFTGKGRDSDDMEGFRESRNQY
jgi:hypothetical protein